MSERAKPVRLFAGAAAAGVMCCLAAAPAVAAPGGDPPPGLPAPAPSIPVETPKQPPPGDKVPADEAGIRQREYWLEDYGVRDAWRQATGRGTTIAVIDTGVDASVPDLRGAVKAGTDVSGVGAENGQRGLGVEPEHGTLVSSLAAGRGHGEPDPDGPGGTDGIIGVAPEAEILPVSLGLGIEEPGVRDINRQIPDAVRWAVDHGADVINMSVGSDSTSWPQEWDSAFEYAEEKNVLIVAAAGNRGSGLTQVGAPATIPGVLTVGGVDRGRRASWDSSSQGISIAVAGPSEDMVGAMPGGKYAEWSGTSATVPLVSATAALIKSKHPEATAAQLADQITRTAHDAGDKGKDPLYGYGILDVAAAVSQDLSTARENPLGSMKHWIAVHRPAATPSAGPTTPAAGATPDTEHVTEEATPPVARAPLNETGALPVVILAGFGLVIAGVTVAAVLHIRSLTR